MKKLALTLAIVLGVAFTGMAQQGGGMLKRSQDYENARNANRMGGVRQGTGDIGLVLPGAHGESNDTPADTMPLGSGIVLLAGMGAAYLVSKKRKD